MNPLSIKTSTSLQLSNFIKEKPDEVQICSFEINGGDTQFKMKEPSEQKKKVPKVYPVDPDRELLLWEKWIAIRKEETTKLAKKTKRPPADLVMNMVENVREDIERKTVLEYAQIPEQPEIRGFLWEQCQRLKQRRYCDPVYEVQRTRAELARPPTVEHIGVPSEIQSTEMGGAGVPEREKCEILDLEYHRYRHAREKELKEKIERIDPFRPEIGGLMVRGSKPKTPPKKLPPLPRIAIDLDHNQCEDLFDVYALRINNTVIYKDKPDQNLTCLEKLKMEPWHEKCSSWTYYFNVSVGRAGRSKLYLKNLGTITLRYCWKKIRKTIPFIPEDIYEQVFFFNKNEDVLAPGQEKEIFFTFVSDKPDIYSETWEFNLCNICFFDTLADKIIVNLHADSVEDIEKTRLAVADIKSEISSKATQNMMVEIINAAIDKATVIVPQIYPYKKYFLEAELFVMKNPVCFYHQTEVGMMKEYYAEMSNNMEWDLSITSWREVLLQQEFDDRMKYYELLRKSHSDFLRPWYEGDDLLKSKYRAMLLLLGQLADTFFTEHMRMTTLYMPLGEGGSTSRMAAIGRSRQRVQSLTAADPLASTTIRNVFYIQMYEHVANTMEACAGVLSSLDLNRWIEFDFCRS